MPYRIRQHSFLLIGILTLCLLLLVRSPNSPPMLLRILIAPMYVAWMLWSVAQVAIFGPVGLPQPLASILLGIGLVAGLAPYALADFILDLWRRRKVKSSA
jgi:hypothetical protein